MSSEIVFVLGMRKRRWVVFVGGALAVTVVGLCGRAEGPVAVAVAQKATTSAVVAPSEKASPPFGREPKTTAVRKTPPTEDSAWPDAEFLSEDRASEEKLLQLVNAAAQGNEVAASALQQLVAAHPTCLYCQSALGEFWFLRGDVARALEVYENLERLGFESDSIRFRLADMYYAAGYRDRAREVFERRLRNADEATLKNLRWDEAVARAYEAEER